MKLKLAGLLFAVILCTSTARADPIITATFLNNDQAVGPNDAFPLTVRIANVGDQTLDESGSSLNLTLTLFGQYGGSLVDIGNVFSLIDGLLAGSSIDVTLVDFEPVPGGAALGNYLADLTATIRHSASPTAPSIVVGNWDEEFRWTVVRAVPESATLALLIAGLAGLATKRRFARQR